MTERFNNNMRQHELVEWQLLIYSLHTKAADNKNKTWWVWLFWKQKSFKEVYEKNPVWKVLRYANRSVLKDRNYEVLMFVIQVLTGKKDVWLLSIMCASCKSWQSPLMINAVIATNLLREMLKLQLNTDHPDLWEKRRSTWLLLHSHSVCLALRSLWTLPCLFWRAYCITAKALWLHSPEYCIFVSMLNISQCKCQQ